MQKNGLNIKDIKNIQEVYEKLQKFENLQKIEIEKEERNLQDSKTQATVSLKLKNVFRCVRLIFLIGGTKRVAKITRS